MIKGGTERLKELMGAKTMNISVKDTDTQIGDTIAGRDYETGMYLQKPVVRKIVKMEAGEVTIEYKVKGEE